MKAVSDISKNGLKVNIRINRTQSEPYTVAQLIVKDEIFPDAKFREWLPKMEPAIKSGDTTLQAAIAKCEAVGKLTEKQIKHLESLAPVVIDDEQNNHDEEEY